MRLGSVGVWKLAINIGLVDSRGGINYVAWCNVEAAGIPLRTLPRLDLQPVHNSHHLFVFSKKKILITRYKLCHQLQVDWLNATNVTLNQMEKNTLSNYSYERSMTFLRWTVDPASALVAPGERGRLHSHATVCHSLSLPSMTQHMVTLRLKAALQLSMSSVDVCIELQLS